MELFCEVFDKKGSFQVLLLLLLILLLLLLLFGICYEERCSCKSVYMLHPCWCLGVEGANHHVVLWGRGCDCVVLFGTEPKVRPAVC